MGAPESKRKGPENSWRDIPGRGVARLKQKKVGDGPGAITCCWGEQGGRGGLKGRGRSGVWKADACEGHRALQVTGRILAVSCWLFGAEDTPKVPPSCGRGDLLKATGLPCTHCLVRRCQAHSSDPLIPEVKLQVCSEVCEECLGTPGHYTCHLAVKGRCMGICPKRASGSQ